MLPRRGGIFVSLQLFHVINFFGLQNPPRFLQVFFFPTLKELERLGKVATSPPPPLPKGCNLTPKGGNLTPKGGNLEKNALFLKKNHFFLLW